MTLWSCFDYIRESKLYDGQDDVESAWEGDFTCLIVATPCLRRSAGSSTSIGKERKRGRLFDKGELVFRHASSAGSALSSEAPEEPRVGLTRAAPSMLRRLDALSSAVVGLRRHGPPRRLPPSRRSRGRSRRRGFLPFSRPTPDAAVERAFDDRPGCTFALARSERQQDHRTAPQTHVQRGGLSARRARRSPSSASTRNRLSIAANCHRVEAECCRRLWMTPPLANAIVVPIVTGAGRVTSRLRSAWGRNDISRQREESRQPLVSYRLGPPQPRWAGRQGLNRVDDVSKGS